MVEQLPRARDFQRRASPQDRGTGGSANEGDQGGLTRCGCAFYTTGAVDCEGAAPERFVIDGLGLTGSILHLIYVGDCTWESDDIEYVCPEEEEA